MGKDPAKAEYEALVAQALAEVLDEVARAERLTHRAIAERAGLRRELVGRIRRQQARPSLPVVLQLARGLGVDAAELLDQVERRVRERRR